MGRSMIQWKIGQAEMMRDAAVEATTALALSALLGMALRTQKVTSRRAARMGKIDLPHKAGGERVTTALGLYDLYPESLERISGYNPERLADAVFWLAHGDGGRPLMRRPVLEVSLAGALLAELALPGKIGLHDGMRSGMRDRVGIFFTPACSEHGEYDYDGEKPADRVSKYVYDEIWDDPLLTLDTWLDVLRRVSLPMVREERLGLGPLQKSTGLVRRAQASLPYVPTSREADRAWSAVTLRIRRLAELSTADAFLIGLGLVTGLEGRLLEGALPDQRRHAVSAVEELPDLLAQIVRHTEAVTARTAVRPRL